MSEQATSQCCPEGIVQPMEICLPPPPLFAREQEALIAGHGRPLPTPKRICRDKAVSFPTFWTWNVCPVFAAWFPVSLGGEMRMIPCTPPPLCANAGFLVWPTPTISILSPTPMNVGSAALLMLPSTALAGSQVFWKLSALPLPESWPSPSRRESPAAEDAKYNTSPGNLRPRPEENQQPGRSLEGLSKERSLTGNLRPRSEENQQPV